MALSLAQQDQGDGGAQALSCSCDCTCCDPCLAVGWEEVGQYRPLSGKQINAPRLLLTSAPAAAPPGPAATSLSYDELAVCCSQLPCSTPCSSWEGCLTLLSYVCVSVSPTSSFGSAVIPRTAAGAGGWLHMSPSAAKDNIICKGLRQPWGQELCVDAQNEICITALPAPTPQK